MKNRLTREELKLRIKRDVLCRDLLEPSKNGLYCCFKCGSGHKEHNTGAVQYNPDDNTWHCHSCGAHGDVLDLLKDKYGGFTAALEYGARQLGVDYPQKRPMEALREHLYPALTGEAGRIKKVMFSKDAPVRASWYHQQSDGTWGKGCKGYAPRLYVAGGELATARVVVVVEGEKDADSVAAFGGVAVSGENGAASWKQEYSAQLAGKHIILLGDNDKPGQDYLDRAQTALLGVAKSIKRLDLRTIWPEIPAGGDISDYIAQVGKEKAKEQIKTLITMTQPIGKMEKTQDLSREEEEFERFFRPLSEYEEEDVEWLVPEYLPRGGIVILAGDGGVGKTSVIANLAAAVSNGQPSILGPAHLKGPGRVLLLNAEDSVRKVLKKRLRLAGVNQERVLCPDFKKETASFSDYQFGARKLERMIRYFAPDLVVFDPFQSFLPQNVNISARNQIRQCLQPLVGLGEQIGCTVVVVCHTNKLGMASGRTRIADSADIWDIARSVLMVGEADGDGLRYLSNEKNSYAPLHDTVLFRIGNATIQRCGTSELRDREYRAQSVMENNGGSKRENAKDAILTLLMGAENGELETGELEAKLKQMGCAAATIRRAREALAKDGKIVRRTVGNGKKGGRKIFWGLPGQGERATSEATLLPEATLARRRRSPRRRCLLCLAEKAAAAQERGQPSSVLPLPVVGALVVTIVVRTFRQSLCRNTVYSSMIQYDSKLCYHCYHSYH